MPASPSRAAHTVQIEEEPAKATLRAQRERSAHPPPHREGYTRDSRTSVPHSGTRSPSCIPPSGEALPFSTSAGRRGGPETRSLFSLFLILREVSSSSLPHRCSRASKWEHGNHRKDTSDGNRDADRGQHLLPNPDLKATVTVLSPNRPAIACLARQALKSCSALSPLEREQRWAGLTGRTGAVPFTAEVPTSSLTPRHARPLPSDFMPSSVREPATSLCAPQPTEATEPKPRGRGFLFQQGALLLVPQVFPPWETKR